MRQTEGGHIQSLEAILLSFVTERQHDKGMFSKSISEVARSWESYRSGKKTNREHPMHKLVVDEIPEVLESWTSNSHKYKFVGSDGQGNILRTPWFATLNLEVTDSATKGYYLVYLMSADLKTLVLTIGFGAYQFEKQYGRGKRFFDALETAVVNMKVNSAHLVSKSLLETKTRTNIGPVSLDKSGDFHLRAYEKCSIYGLSYDINKLPSETELKRDYQEYVNLYDSMSDSLLLADVDSYVYEAIDEQEIKSEVQLTGFEPRVFKKRKSGSSTNGNSGSRRYSKKSDKVGKLGEEIVFEFEKKKLINENRRDLADRVNWHREDAGSRTPGWDITSYNKNGQEIYIEVKASESQKINDVELTIKEWIQAEKNIESNQYMVYLVSDVFSNPIIEVIENPALMVKKGQLTLSIARYQLLLGVKVD